MSSNSESRSSVPQSITNQTKDKFDALLRIAKNKKRNRKAQMTQSKEKLLNDLESTTASSDNLLDKVEEFELKDQSQNYILNKFLTQSGQFQTTQNVGVKPPVPKPRTKRYVSPTVSQGTFEVTSPKFDKHRGESSSSDKTYNVEPVGDIVVHQSPLRPQIIVKNKVASDKFVEKGDTEALSDNESSVTEEPHKTSKIKEKNCDNEELNEDSIEYVNEKLVKTKSQVSEDDDVDLKKKQYSYDKIIEIIIHKTDRLQLNSLVVHPVVKIHVVDGMSGKYFPKSDKTRSVVFFYENNQNDYISPVMTHSYNLQEKRILFPSWEENILLNEDYEYFKDESHHIMLFFEVLDFVSFSELHQLNQKDLAKGWHNIAFAFLKLSGKNGALNAGKKLRLQLYYSHLSKKYDPQICQAWVWWKKRKLVKYPSTLYVTIKSTISPTKIAETFRSKTPIQRETSSRIKLVDDGVHKSELPRPEDAISSSDSNKDLKASISAWVRRSNEICDLPNKCLVKFNSYEQGCFVMKFSPSGKYLACAVQIEDLFYVVVYSVITLKEVNKFPCHQALIYNIKWSSDDSLLLTASADNTVAVFSLSSYSFFQILPHPHFVYSCDISHEKIIASGCYDGIVRIWNYKQTDRKLDFHLFQELEAHKGYITSLCFNKKSNVFSADSTGVIIEWEKEKEDWTLKREIHLLDLKETIINQIMLFPKEKRLLVHSRDSTIRIIDIKSGCVLQWLRRALNRRFQIFCTISPCGTYVFSGSENGTVHVWNAKNGREIAVYSPFSDSFSSDYKFLTVHCVDFHPCDNIMAISHYGKALPILLYSFDRDIKQPTVNVNIKDQEFNSGHKWGRLKEVALKGAVKRNPDLVKSQEKFDLKGILEKMDTVITAHQKS